MTRSGSLAGHDPTVIQLFGWVWPRLLSEGVEAPDNFGQNQIVLCSLGVTSLAWPWAARFLMTVIPSPH